jgi:hypothetical protein
MLKILIADTACWYSYSIMLICQCVVNFVEQDEVLCSSVDEGVGLVLQKGIEVVYIIFSCMLLMLVVLLMTITLCSICLYMMS